MGTSKLNIVICTTPIRVSNSDFPPLASMAVIQALRAQGYDPHFLDIDGLRTPFDQVEKFFTERQPDVLGISAVVSTAYEYVKRLSTMLHRVSPKTRIIVGGNLAASAEILHRLAGIDYCVTGEGEITGPNLVNYIAGRVEQGLPGDDYEALNWIKGITFLDAKGAMVNTGFERTVATEDLYDPDYTILEKHSDIDLIITEHTNRPDYIRDPRSQQPHRAGKKMGTVFLSKGCVARCTFCHRWEKGYRTIPMEKVIRQIKYLVDRYNVGFVQIADENFGSDKKQLAEWIEAIKPLDIIYHVAGVRTRTVSPEMLKSLKDSGCVAAYFGMETGSPRILQVMEKNLTCEHSANAARWTHEAGLFTIFQLIIGMPGECPSTIDETIEFLKKGTEVMDAPPIKRLSMNFIQALPGTPVYEYARHKGLLGKSLAEEEAYLLLVSDTEADDDTKFINFTDWDYLTVQSWRRRIVLECTANWRKKNSIPPPSLKEMYQHTILRWISPASYEALKRAEEAKDGLAYHRGGYFNLQRGLYYDIIASYFYPLRTPILWSWLLMREFKRLGTARFSVRAWEAIKRRVFGPDHDAYADYRSLRKVVNDVTPEPETPNEAAMAPLRAGR